jgi:hypothetical protein
MQLIKKPSFMNEYFCELTNKLDNVLIGKSDIYRVYILDCRDPKESQLTLVLRVPGCTVGYIVIDNDTMCIISGEIYNRSITRFSLNPNDIIKNYIGVKLENLDSIKSINSGGVKCLIN